MADDRTRQLSVACRLLRTQPEFLLCDDHALIPALTAVKKNLLHHCCAEFALRSVVLYLIAIFSLLLPARSEANGRFGFDDVADIAKKSCSGTLPSGVKVNTIDERGVNSVPFSPQQFTYGKNKFKIPENLGFAGFRLAFPFHIDVTSSVTSLFSREPVTFARWLKGKFLDYLRGAGYRYRATQPRGISQFHRILAGAPGAASSRGYGLCASGQPKRSRCLFVSGSTR